jgi:hypothetical protein
MIIARIVILHEKRTSHCFFCDWGPYIYIIKLLLLEFVDGGRITIRNIYVRVCMYVCMYNGWAITIQPLHRYLQ